MTQSEYDQKATEIARRIDAETSRPTTLWNLARLMREAEDLQREWYGECVARECAVEPQ